MTIDEAQANQLQKGKNWRQGMPKKQRLEVVSFDDADQSAF
jgi:hypothetical protein